MGNTVRREPVNFNIPASPNYKFLNITNFRGLDVSSNPFELAPNTASDCLNVYVDETNTLTTRPRLCKKEFKNANGDFIVPLGGTCIGVYNLHNGYLLHHIIDDKPIMRLFVDGVLKEPVSGDLIPTTQCKHFEHGDEIYLLTGSDYLVIKDNVISKVEGYIPNKSIKTLDGREIDDEQLNILSDKYTSRYFWDGINNPSVDLVDSSVENKYLETVSLGLSHKKRLCHIYKDHCYLYYDTTLQTLFYVNCDKNFVTNNEVQLNIQLYNENIIGYFIAGRDTKAFWFIDASDGLIKYCKIKEDDTFTITTKTSTLNPTNNSVILSAVSHDNERIVVNYVRDGENRICAFKTSVGYSTSDIKSPSSSTINMAISHVSEQYYYVMYDGANVLYYVLDGNSSVVTLDEDVSKNAVIGWSVTPTTGVIYFTHYDGFTIYKNFDMSTKQKITGLNGFGGQLSDDLSYATTLVSKPNKQYSLDYYIRIFPNFPELTDAYTLNIPVGFSPANAYKLIELKDIVVYQWWLTDVDYTITNIKITPNANIVKTNILTSSDKKDIDLDNSRNKLVSSKLYIRFDNNYWVTKDNKYFRTANNDPTYFPITEYNELGDSNESITGFNIANDTTLLAYKTHRVYLIQPFTSSLDTREYAITESKNTVGNTAIDAPIVTTLTEIPLQINYDGIYGLSQLQNVSAVERIADLMSEPINDRWLNEDDKVIKKAQTLNRLYWTYIILPYDDITKIYLLDNRTNSWYYWELPIKLLTAFAKDNRAEFVDTDGNIYYLTTTDIKNAGFDTQLVTEYYDDGKKLINWFWQSQILPMGTMNYAKRLVNTTFILTDTDTQDGYGLKYNFKVFRKLASSTPEKEITDELNLVRSTTKKTNISKFGFIQLKISNITEESQGTEAEKAYRNNKLRLVGLGLKYVLLEGLIR